MGHKRLARWWLGVIFLESKKTTLNEGVTRLQFKPRAGDQYFPQNLWITL